MPQADPHLGVAKELLLRSRGRGGGRGVVCWAGRAFVCHGCGGAGQAPRGCPVFSETASVRGEKNKKIVLV